MTRFNILAIIAGQNQPIAKLSGRRGWDTRSFRASLATRLRKLWRWGAAVPETASIGQTQAFSTASVCLDVVQGVGNDSRGHGREERSIRWTTNEEFRTWTQAT
jgi:hypothetical protein